MSFPKYGGGPGELRAGELHAVAGVAGEADRDALELALAPWGAPGRWSRALRFLHPLVGAGREVQQLLRERLGEVLEHVDRADDPDEAPGVVDERDVPVAAGLHEVDRVADRLVQVERPGVLVHERLDRLVQVHVVARRDGRRCRARSGRR